MQDAIFIVFFYQQRNRHSATNLTTIFANQLRQTRLNRVIVVVFFYLVDFVACLNLIIFASFFHVAEKYIEFLLFVSHT